MLEVLDRMAVEDKDVQLSPLSSNLRGANYSKKSKSTRLDVAVVGNVIKQITFGESIGVLILADKAQFIEVKERMEKERKSKT
jgi:hypothetical protein